MCSETTHTLPGSPPTHPIKTWLTLLRAPNLLTVPGDPVAGAFLAAAGAQSAMAWTPIFQCILASLSLYSSGLLANDYFDREEDRQERPFRPIPSGAAQPRSVLITAILFSMAANAFAAEAGKGALLISLLLTAAVWAYNMGVKRLPLAGPFLMGTCRGLSLLLGAAACPSTPAVTPWLAAGFITVYIAVVTDIARTETHAGQTRGGSLIIPATIILLGLSGLMFLHWEGVSPVFTLHASAFALGLSAMAVVWAGVWSGLLAGCQSPATVQRVIGGLIRGMILIQAAVCAISGPIGEIGALAILLAFPISGWLGKRFYGS
jgi:4-hydroxybenzoate polyprenyltransferase